MLCLQCSASNALPPMLPQIPPAMPSPPPTAILRLAVVHRCRRALQATGGRLNNLSPPATVVSTDIHMQVMRSCRQQSKQTEVVCGVGLINTGAGVGSHSMVVGGVSLLPTFVLCGLHCPQPHHWVTTGLRTKCPTYLVHQFDRKHRNGTAVANLYFVVIDRWFLHCVLKAFDERRGPNMCAWQVRRVCHRLFWLTAAYLSDLHGPSLASGRL